MFHEKLYIEPAAKIRIGLDIKRQSCSTSERYLNDNISCKAISRPWAVDCNDKYIDPIALWWPLKNSKSIEKFISEKYALFDYNFESLKKWFSCQGFIIGKDGKYIYISILVSEGYGLFRNAWTELPYGETLQIEEAESRVLKIKFGFTVE